MIYRFEELGSTNDTARAYGHGDVVRAERQTAGRGQRGHRWMSTAENLLLSYVWEGRLAVAGQFALSQAAALSVCDVLAALDPRIKWTNDIYIGDRKVAGILIENDLKGGVVARSIIGIGLNVNQSDFDPDLPNPTSVRIETGRAQDREQLFAELVAALERRFSNLTGSERAYHERIYRLGVERTFYLPDGTPLRGAIQRVEKDGRIVIKTAEKEEKFAFGQIEWKK